MSRRNPRHGVLAVLALAAGTAISLVGCTSDEPSARVSTQRSAVETSPQADVKPTFQTAAKEAIDWKSVLDQLGKDNIFRILYKAATNAKDRSDDGMSSLDPAEQKIFAQYKSDMNEVYRLYALQGPKELGEKERARVAELQKTYAPARQELYKVLMARPELSAEGREAFHTAIDQINGSRAMQLDTSNL